MTSKIYIWIVIIYRLNRCYCERAGPVGPWSLFSQWQGFCTSYVIVYGVWSQAAEIPSVMSAASDFSPYENSVAVSWSKTCFEYMQEQEM
jgi:hypothetical protein